MTTVTAAAKRDTPTVSCGGDGCDSRDRWPLHNIRHRGVFCRLCTSCVLRYHPAAFCSICFDVFDSPPPPDHPLVHCSKCPAVSHLSCLPDPDTVDQYLCPSCSNPHGFTYFPAGVSREAPVKNPAASDGEERPAEERRRTIDLSSSKVLLAAARLAASSMSRAAAAARAEAERKVKEAAMARKRAREMLERALSLAKKEKEKIKESVEMAIVPMEEVAEPKKKPPRVAPAVLAQKRVQDRQRDKWMKFHEPIEMTHRPPIQGIAGKDTSNGSSINSMQNDFTADMKDRVGSPSHRPNLVKQAEREKEAKVLVSNSQSASVKEEEKVLKVETDKGTRMPQSTQDASVSRSNNRPIFTGSQNTASLHS